MNGNIPAEARAFLQSHTAGILATVSSDGKPHASAVYYVADDNFNSWQRSLLLKFELVDLPARKIGSKP